MTMRLPKFSYAPAHSLAEAVQLLKDHGPQAMVVAGGTDVYPNMKRRVWQPEVLVGLRGVRELRGIGEAAEGGLRLGAGATLTQVAASPAVREKYSALATAARLISTPQLRNMGTIGGNVCLDTRCFYYDQSAFWRKALGYCMKAEGDVCRVALSSPKCLATFSSDTVPTLIGYGASIRLVGPEGERTVALADLYQNDGMHWLKIQPGEIVAEVSVPDPEGLRATYYKLRDRGSFDFPIAGVFVGVRTDTAGLVDRARVVTTGIYSMPTVVPEAEEILVGNRLEADVIAATAEAVYAKSRPVDNTAGSIIQRRRTVRVFVRRALEELGGTPREPGGMEMV
jgi:4-hydroxybenzoyl-CoA reductase subunit beta